MNMPWFYYLLYSIAAVVTLVVLIWLFNTYRKNDVEEIDRSIYDELSEEDKEIYDSLPNMENVEYVQLREIDTHFNIKEGEIPLAHIDVKTISVSKHHREVEGGTGNLSVLGISLGLSKRKIKNAYEKEESKVHRTLITDKKIYVDSVDKLYDFTLRGILLVDYVGDLTVRIVHSKYKAGILLKFGEVEEIEYFLRIYLIYKQLGRLGDFDE